MKMNKLSRASHRASYDSTALLVWEYETDLVDDGNGLLTERIIE